MEKLIYKWLNSGIINKETADLLFEDVKKEKLKQYKTRLNIAIYTVSSILIGIGIITFISANDWFVKMLSALPVIKVIIITSLVLSSFYLGYKLTYEKKSFPKLGNAMTFLSTLLLGADYALIGQIYNINANNSSLMFLWMFSIIPVAYIFKKSDVNILAIILYILGTIFYYMELNIDKGLTWTVFIPLFIGTALYSIGNINFIKEKYNKFSLSYKITGLSPIFFTLFLLTCSVQKSYNQNSPYYIVPIILLIVFNFINFIIRKNPDILFKIETGFILTILISLLLMIVLPEVSIISVMVLSNLAIITIIVIGFYYGYKFENNCITEQTNRFLIIYLTLNYFRWGWDFMDKALFFLTGGISLLLLGIFLENKRKQLLNKDK